MTKTPHEYIQVINGYIRVTYKYIRVTCGYKQTHTVTYQYIGLSTNTQEKHMMAVVVIKMKCTGADPGFDEGGFG